MGQRYEGILVIQTNDYYSPVGSRILTPVKNPASSDDVVPGKGLYGSNGNYIGGSLVDGWPVEIDTEEGMDAFVTSDNINRYVKYTGVPSETSTAKYTSGQIYQMVQQGELAELKPILY